MKSSCETCLLKDSCHLSWLPLHRGMIAFTKSDAPAWQGYTLAVLLFLTAMLLSIVQQQDNHAVLTVGMRVRSGIIAAVYRKVPSMS